MRKKMKKDTWIKLIIAVVIIGLVSLMFTGCASNIGLKVWSKQATLRKVNSEDMADAIEAVTVPETGWVLPTPGGKTNKGGK